MKADDKWYKVNILIRYIKFQADRFKGFKRIIANDSSFKKGAIYDSNSTPDLLEGRGVCRREKPLGIKELRIDGNVFSVNQVSGSVRIPSL